ncbi:helix-turn-helix domain-containing protein [Bacillus altitudinis]|uniref:helix-turn-helix domain-containing protein n=1 Tax=Bacillus altitudinis TaxID=293387 RepID=UPI0011B57218|nr:helix-turn-helix transcriptional regulator [Bacillus altitudinis]QDZ93827.1 XRE family transcriptional regulator [Bacillus altitudinis]
MSSENITGSRIRLLRKERKMSQDALAKKLNVNRSTVANYEVGRISPTMQILLELSNIFGVSADYLLGIDSNNDIPHITPGQIVRKERLKKGFTQSHLATLVGVDQRTISNIERADSEASLELFNKISKVFGYLDWEDLKAANNINFSKKQNKNKHNIINTIAAHHDGGEWTTEELEEIERFLQFIKSKREQN